MCGLLISLLRSIQRVVGIALLTAIPCGAVAQSIRIGLVHPLSGFGAFEGAEERQAVLMAVEEINRAGGINGRRIEPVSVDAYSPPVAFDKVRQLISQDRVSAIFGSSLLDPVAIGRVVEEANVLFFYPWIDPGNGTARPHVVYAGGSMTERAKAISDQFRNSNVARWIVIRDSRPTSSTQSQVLRAVLATQQISATEVVAGPDAPQQLRREVQGRRAVILSLLNPESTKLLAASRQELDASSLDIVGFNFDDVHVTSPTPELWAPSLGRASASLTRKWEIHWRSWQRAGPIPPLSTSIVSSYYAVHAWVRAVSTAGALDTARVETALRGSDFEMDRVRVRFARSGLVMLLPIQYVSIRAQDAQRIPQQPLSAFARSFSVPQASIFGTTPSLPPSPTRIAPAESKKLDRLAGIRAIGPGAAQQTIRGEGATGSVNVAIQVAVNSPNKPAPPKSPPDNKNRQDEQKNCDARLTAADVAFSSWQKSSGEAAAVGLNVDTFWGWYRDSNKNAAAGVVAKAVVEAMTACYDKDPPESFPNDVASRIGALERGPGKRDCSGMRVSSDLILTARHCVEIATGDSFRLASQAELVTYKFFDAGGAAGVAVKGLSGSGPVSVRVEDDWALLKTDPRPGTFDAIASVQDPAQIAPGTPMLVGGYISATDAAGPFKPGFNAGNTCLALYATRQCVAHTCNTVPGLSGAPLFAYIADKWTFIGVHARAFDQEEWEGNSCKHAVRDNLKGGQVNGGAYVRPEMGFK